MKLMVQWKIYSPEGNETIRNGTLIQVIALRIDAPFGVVMRADRPTFELVELGELKYVG